MHFTKIISFKKRCSNQQNTSSIYTYCSVIDTPCNLSIGGTSSMHNSVLLISLRVDIPEYPNDGVKLACQCDDGHAVLSMWRSV